MDKQVSEEKLQALFMEYAKNLPNKIQALHTEWQALKNDWTVEQLKNFHRNVHSLTGSAGTYGYKALSQAARQLEIYLKIVLEENNSISNEQLEEINCLLTKLNAMPASPVSFKPLTTTATTENKLIFVVDQDIEFVNQLKLEWQDSDYHVLYFDSLQALFANPDCPATIIITPEFLHAQEFINYLEQKNKNAEKIQLICIANTEDLLTRLQAIRAGGTAFYYKHSDLSQLTQKIDEIYGQTIADHCRVLIVDDSVSLAEYYSIILQEAGMVTRALNQPLDLIDAIIDFQPDLLLMDIYMPECTGLELAAVLRQEPAYTHLPIVFLSTEDDKLKQLFALNVGGDDFLTKPVLPQHLVAAVQSRAKRAGILSSYIVRDSLTSLLNHTNILHQLKIELRIAAQKNHALSFAMLDIDHFKNINDTYGHPTGDYVLKKLAQFLRLQLRASDVIGRYGGEEFAVILPGADLNAAKNICDSIRQKFSQLEFTAGDKIFNVTFSAGIAYYPNIKDAESMVVAADQALYKAKHLGRNQIAT